MPNWPSGPCIPSTAWTKSRTIPAGVATKDDPDGYTAAWNNHSWSNNPRMREMTIGPRVLLRRLRELMAEPLEPQVRLDHIVKEIARNMVAEVCSIYVLRADAVLELYATEGLNPSSVHLAQLRLGQGLVGTIAASAAPLNLSNAQEHPAFAYLPETGEEIYNSFLGVPILRAGRTLGVLTVQNRTKRIYREDEAEALETTAMVLAEMIASGDLTRLNRPGVELDLRKPMSFDGVAFNDGVGLGHVVLHEPRIVVTNLFNEDTDAELQRLRDALGSLRLSIDDMLSSREVAFEGEHRAVLEAYRMFAYDHGWARRLEEAIRNGLTAEAAVEKVQSDTRARMVHLTDPYLRERLSDFDDLANRLLRQLMGRDVHSLAATLPKDAIIVARSMGAAELLDYPRDRLRGLVLEDGSATSHVVIVARAVGIPVAGEVKGAVSMAENEDAIIVDGDEGRVHLRPQTDVEAAYAEKVRFRARRQAHFRELRDKPARQPGRRARFTAHECGPARRPAAACRIGCGRDRTVPHRAAVHDRLDLSACRGSGAALPLRAGSSGRPAGDVPDPRRRWRQGAALFPRWRRGRKPVDGLACDPAQPRPAGAPAHPASGASQGCGRARVAADAADGHRGCGNPPGARDHRSRGQAPVAVRAHACQRR